MRVKMREVVNIDKPVDISKLSPLQKILVSIRYSWRNTNYYRNRRERELSLKYRMKADREEALKNELLTYIYSELMENRFFKQRAEKQRESDRVRPVEVRKCSSIVLAVDRSYEEDLRRVLKHKEFISFSITYLDCNPDMLKSFNKIPILLEVRYKVLGGEDIGT